MWVSASSAPRRRGRHLLLGLASPLLPCSRWPPPPSPTTRRAGSGGGDVQELRSSRRRGRCLGASTWPWRCPGDSIRQGQRPRAQDPAPTPTPRSSHSNVQKHIYLLHLSEPFERPIHDVQIWSWDAFEATGCRNFRMIQKQGSGHFLRKLLLDGRRFPKNASRSTAVSLVNLWNQCHPLNHHHQMKASFGSN
ncbi:uncharacterized protein [Miscanthus floridulus]|uniref:uncharacterized protein n=1 Tax=Miscanthus floridulus TaxID=154761 RepID=UPI003457BF73